VKQYDLPLHNVIQIPILSSATYHVKNIGRLLIILLLPEASDVNFVCFYMP